MFGNILLVKTPNSLKCKFSHFDVKLCLKDLHLLDAFLTFPRIRKDETNEHYLSTENFKSSEYQY